MHSSDLSLIYPLLLLTYKVTGDYVLSYKLLTSILCGFLVIIIGLTVKKWTHKNHLAVLLASLTAFSPHLSYFSSQFPKNLLGIVLFILLLYFIDSKKKLVMLFLIILNYFGHRMTAVLSIISVTIYFFTEIKHAKKILLFGSIFVLLFSGSLFIPGVLNPLDLERFNNILAIEINFPLKSFQDYFGEYRLSAIWKTEIIVYSLLFYIFIVLLLVKRDFKNNKYQFVLLMTLMILVAPIYKWSVDGAAFRFYLAFIVLAPLTLTSIHSFLPDKKYLKFSFYIVSGILITVRAFTSYGYNSELHDPSYDFYNSITDMALKKVPQENIELIIAHKSLAEYFTFKTGIDVLPWEVEYEVQKEKLWRIVTDIEYQTLKYYTEKEEKQYLFQVGINYFILRDDVWRKILLKIENENESDILERLNTWRNPSRIRPNYLLKNKR